MMNAVDQAATLAAERKHELAHFQKKGFSGGGEESQQFRQGTT
jgi:hypothetical protein